MRADRVRRDAPATLAATVREAEHRTISQAMAATACNVSRAAALLGIARNTLKRKLRVLGLRYVNQFA